MRFAKHKGSFGALEAHHERNKAKYASNPNIDTSKSKDNFHIVQPSKSYLQETNTRIASAGCKVRKDSVKFVDTIITASPEFFKDKTREEIHSFFQTSVDFLSQKIGKDNIFAAVVHMDEKTPHMHLCFIIQEYYSTEEGKRAFAEWKAKQQALKEPYSHEIEGEASNASPFLMS